MKRNGGRRKKKKRIAKATASARVYAVVVVEYSDARQSSTRHPSLQLADGSENTPKHWRQGRTACCAAVTAVVTVAAQTDGSGATSAAPSPQ